MEEEAAEQIGLGTTTSARSTRPTSDLWTATSLEAIQVTEL